MTPSGQHTKDAPDPMPQSIENCTGEQSGPQSEQDSPVSTAPAADQNIGSRDEPNPALAAQPSSSLPSLKGRGSSYPDSALDDGEYFQRLEDQAQEQQGNRRLNWRGGSYASSGASAAQSQAILQGSRQLSWRGVNYPGPGMSDRDYLQRLEALAEAGVVPVKKASRQGVSLRIQATALAAMLGVLPVLVVGGFAFQVVNHSMTTRVDQQELDETKQVAGQLTQYMEERLADIQTFATVLQTFPGGDARFRSTEPTSVAPELTAMLTQLLQNHSAYVGLGVFDREGQLLAQSEGGELAENQLEADYFQQVLQTGQPVLSDPVPVDSLGDAFEDLQPFAVYVAAPVFDSEGNTVAVVAAQVPVDFIGNTVLKSAVAGDEAAAEGEFYRLVDSSGMIFQTEPPVEGQTAAIGVPIAEQVPGFAAVHQQREAQGWVEQNAERSSYNVYAPVTGFSGTTWSVVASSDGTAPASALQQQLLRTVLLGSALTTIATVLLGVWLARRATRPIKQMAQAVEQLGQGQLDTRVCVKGDDELATLGASINRMAGQIQILLQTLRQNAAQLGRQNDVLAELARHEALVQGDARRTAKGFAEAVARTLDLDRVSVWVYEREPGTLVCLAEYHLSTDQHNCGTVLMTEQVPEYFEAVTQKQVLAIEHLSRDAVGQSLVAHHLLAADTVSLLEVSIQVAGSFAGSLRCEHKGQPRQWNSEERTFVNSVANLVALALESDVMQGEVSHLLDVVSAVEDGNLDTQARVSDRTTGLVADTFNRLIERLSEVLHQAMETTRLVADSANQQQSQARVIATNAERQSDGVNQVLRLTAQVEALARETADRVDTGLAFLQTLQTLVEQGQKVMADLTTGIDILQGGSDRIIQQMKTLGEFVGLADQFVQDQSQIASQTQTLAINASLVAARAAEQQDPYQFAVAAREFSTIASQVSQLAQQTNASLVSLEQRSAQIQSVVFTVDANVQKVGSLVEDFTRGVEQSNQVFDEVQSVTVAAVKAEAVVAEASQAIIEAVHSATNVARVITDMAAQTAELTQHNQAQSSQMETLAKQLLDTMAFFRLPAPTSIPPQIQPNGSGFAPQSPVTVSAQPLA